ncbi:MAG: hypothetical protein AAF585_23920 [Verrucomicrobiota bacterium]
MKTNLLSGVIIACSALALYAETLDRVGLPCVGAYEEVTFQRQQLAVDANGTPTFINVGSARRVENWIEPEGRQVLEGRLSKFEPPQFIIHRGKKFKLLEASEEPNTSGSEVRRTYKPVTGEPVVGDPPEGYEWSGEIRVVIRKQVIHWSRSWLYEKVEK